MSEVIFLKILALVFVCFSSTYIAFYTRRVIDNKGLSIENLFFNYNNVFRASVSNISSAFSINFFFGLVIFSAYGWGMYSIFCIIIAILFSMLTWLKIISCTTQFKNNIQNDKISIINFLSYPFNDSKKKYTKNALIFLTLIVIGYLLICEFAILRIYLSSLYSDQFSKIIIVFFAVLCFIYSITGGFYGVLKTDQFQSLIILLFLCITAYNVIYHSEFRFTIDIFWSDADGISGYTNPMLLDILNYISAFLFVYFALLLYPDFWMRNVITLKKEEDSKRSILISFPVIILLILLPSYIGLNANMLMPHPGGILNYNFDAIKEIILSFINGGLGFFLLICALLCASLTTVDSLIVTLIQLFFTDIINHDYKKSRDGVLLIKYIIFLFVLILFISMLSFWIDRPNEELQIMHYNLISWPIFGVILGSVIIYPGYLLLFQLLSPTWLKRVIAAHKDALDIVVGYSLYCSFVLGIGLSILNHSYTNEIRSKLGEVWHPVIPTLLFPAVLIMFLLISIRKLSAGNNEE